MLPERPPDPRTRLFPGGALTLTLWRNPGNGQYFVRTRFVAQTLDQMRDAERLTAATPPASQELPVPGRETAARKIGYPWREFHLAIAPAAGG